MPGERFGWLGDSAFRGGNPSSSPCSDGGNDKLLRNFRLYGPMKPWFDEGWRLPEFETDARARATDAMPQRKHRKTVLCLRVLSLTIASVAFHAGTTRAQGKVAVWLDEAKPAAWNNDGSSIPDAPKIDADVDPRCREQARPPQLDEDKQVRDAGWNLVGAYQGGWQILVIQGTAGYDGMCRPRQFQDFVFVRGVFAGTLSPHPMDSRSDGVLGRVFLSSGSRLTAEYERYAAKDPLCCPSRTTSVTFEIGGAAPVVQPVSTFTNKR
jgi:hypothetical protein